jgi:hypothetical protein
MSCATPQELRHYPRTTPYTKATPHPVSHATPNELRHTARATTHRKIYATPQELRHNPRTTSYTKATPHPVSYATPHFKLMCQTSVTWSLPPTMQNPHGTERLGRWMSKVRMFFGIASINSSSRVTCTTSHLRVQQLIRPIERGWRAAHPLRAEGRVGP